MKELEEKYNQEKVIEKEHHREVKLSLIHAPNTMIHAPNEKRDTLNSSPYQNDDLDQLLGGPNNNGLHS